jgi:hypothetical protein
MYISSYITKAERELGPHFLKQAKKEEREGNQEAMQELKRLGQVYMNHGKPSTGMKLKPGTSISCQLTQTTIAYVEQFQQ